MSLDTLADAFYDELRDMLSAERQLVKALPKMAKNANSKELKQAITDHLRETERQVERVERAFEDTGKAPRAKTCDGMQGLIEEAEKMLAEEADPAVRDAVIISAAQKVEHYEIASYGTLCTWAEALNYSTALELLQQNIEEEKACDETLTEIAESSINAEALAGQA
jgi:ferritin-like metal-binding protein YciE